MKYLPLKSQIKRLFILSAMTLIAVYCMGFSVSAEECPSAVSVKAILPENQVGNVSYYDLRLSPGDSQTVQMKISNSDEKPVVATVELNPATTGIGGTIIYNHTDNLDESLTHPIGEIARVRTPVVEIPAKTSVLVDIDIMMPDEEIDGVILGGLRVTADYPEHYPDETQSGQEQGLQIKNKFAYVIGLKLSQNNKEAAPDFHLKDIRPGLVNFTTAVIVNIQNSEPGIAKNILFSAQIFQKGSQTVLKELVKENAEMAPNSNCDYVVEWGSTRMQPGTYRMLIRMQHNDRVWEWDEEFNVAAGEAGSINGGALGLIEDTAEAAALKYIIASMLLILIVLLAYILDKRRLKERKA